MSIEKTIRDLVKESQENIAEKVGADKVGDGPKTAPGNNDGVDEPHVKVNNTNQSVIAKSNLKQGNPDAKSDATAPEKKFPSHFSAPGQTREELEVDVSADVEALMNGEDLSEEFKTKATTIFEAAVVSRVKTEVAKLEEAFEQLLQEQFEEAAEGLVEQVDGYLALVAEKWLKDNALALESGLKTEITEGFISGLKTLFQENYIDVPEEKFDVLAALEEEVSTLTAKLDESVAETVTLTRTLSEMKKSEMVAEAAAGLTDVEVEKFTTLADELVFESAEAFASKLQTIRESYFAKKSGGKTIVESVVTNAPVDLTEENVPTGRMAQYAQALERFNK
jgi:uncharacterized protein YsxB (DUF464 family)